MKKIIYLLVIVFTCSLVNAQDVSFGLKAGVNYGKMKSSDSDENKYVDPVIGPHFGIVADIPIDEKFSVQPELLYSSTGYKISYSMEYWEAEYNGKLNYVSIPIMGKYKLKDGLYIEAGPYFGYLLSAKEDGESSDTFKATLYSYDNEDVKEYFKSLDIGLGIGAGYQLENGLYFNARYTLGLIDINNEDMMEYKFYHTSTVHNHIFMICIGFFFNNLFVINQTL